MTVGNAWLGSLVAQSLYTSQLLSANSMVLATPVLSVASTFDRVTVKVADMTETMMISIVPVAGTDYSTVLFASSTSGHTSFFYQPDRPLFLAPGDYITVKVSNGDATGIAYASILTLY